MNDSQFKELCAMSKHDVFIKYSKMLMNKIINQQQYANVWKLYEEHHLDKVEATSGQLAVEKTLEETGLYYKEDTIRNLTLLFGGTIKATSTVFNSEGEPF